MIRLFLYEEIISVRVDLNGESKVIKSSGDLRISADIYANLAESQIMANLKKCQQRRWDLIYNKFCWRLHIAKICNCSEMEVKCSGIVKNFHTKIISKNSNSASTI